MFLDFRPSDSPVPLTPLRRRSLRGTRSSTCSLTAGTAAAGTVTTTVEVAPAGVDPAGVVLDGAVPIGEAHRRLRARSAFASERVTRHSQQSPCRSIRQRDYLLAR